MKRLLAIFAHPDDESAVGGTLAHYAQNGTDVTLICATRGEAGEISDPGLATPEILGQVRQIELQNACRYLGIQHLEFLDYRDSGMKDTPENDDPRALIQADEGEVTAKIVSAIRRIRPHVVITFEPFGWYGHPDHIAVSRLTTAAVAAASDQYAYPDAGLAWQPDGFYYAVLPFSQFKEMIMQALNAGILKREDINFNPPEDMPQVSAEEQVTHILDVSRYIAQKQLNFAAHKTQFSADHMFRKMPLALVQRFLGQEYFIQVQPNPDPGLIENPQTDLFATLETLKI